MAMNKTQLVQSLIADSDISKKQAQHLLEALATLASTSLKSDGTFTIPGIVKLTLKDKPATAERQGINPFSKAPVTIPAKPASKKVKALPVAALKNAVA